MTRPLVMLSIAALLSGPAAAAESLRPTDFAAGFALVDVVEGLNAVELSEPVYRAAAHRSLADLRVYNANGEALPLAILPAPPLGLPEVRVIDLTLVALPAERAARDAALQAYALRFERDRTRTVIEIRDDPRIAAPDAAQVGGYLIDARPLKDMKGRLLLRFSEQAPNFAGHAQVLGSEDLVNWRTLATGPLARERRLGDTVEKVRFEVDRPPSFVRMAWSGRDAPQIEGARFEEIVVRTAALPRAALAVSVGEDRRSLFVDVPHALPIERLFVRTPQPNQSLRVSVYRHVADPASRGRRIGVVPRRAPEHWVPAGTIDVFRVQRNAIEVEGPPLPFTSETDRLRLDAATPLPDPLPFVEAEWRPHRIAFAARAPGPYRIAIGHEGAAAGPLLNLSTVLPTDDRAGVRLPQARIDATAALSPAADTASRRAERIAAQAHWSRNLLWGVLLAAVAGLAWMAWRLAAQLRRPTANADPR